MASSAAPLYLQGAPPPPSLARRSISNALVTNYMKTREVLQYNLTSVLVDAFRYTAHYRNMKQQAHELNGGNPYDQFGSIYFLSHYHSDHYTGLHPGWNFGTIFTGEVTGALLIHHLGLPKERVVSLKRGMTYRISLITRTLVEGSFPQPFQACHVPHSNDELEVTLVDANHCPGADMLVMRHAVYGTILHTGDFRFNGTSASLMSLGLSPANRLGNDEFVGENPILTQIAGRVKRLFLDNTFCDPSFKFEPQESAFQHIVNVVKGAFVNQYHRKYSENAVVVTAGDDDMESIKGSSIVKCKCSATPTQSRRKCVHVAVMVGTYTIGKERMALALQRAFKGAGGAVPPIMVSEQKKSLLNLTDLSDCGFVQTPSMDSCGADVPESSRKTIEADFVETEIDLISLCDASSAGSDSTSKQLFGLKHLVDENVACFLTLFLVPLQILSYRNLSSCLSNDITPTPNGVNYRPPRTFFLWDRCYLPVDNFDVIACIEPTGWVSSKTPKTKYISRKFELTSVPYSEHSSFTEMLDFVKFVRPDEIVPTVSLEQYAKQEKEFLQARGQLRKHGPPTLLTKFAHLFRKPTNAGELVDATLLGGSKKQAIPTFEAAPAQQAVNTATTEEPQTEEDQTVTTTIEDKTSITATATVATKTAIESATATASSITTIESGVASRKRPRIDSHHRLAIDDADNDVVVVSAKPICIEVD